MTRLGHATWWRCTLEARRPFDGARLGERTITVQAASRLDAEVAAIRQAEHERANCEWRCVDTRREFWAWTI